MNYVSRMLDIPRPHSPWLCKKSLGEPPLWHKAEALLTWPPSPRGHQKPLPQSLEMHPEETCGQLSLFYPL